MGEHRLQLLVLEEPGRVDDGRATALGADDQPKDTTLVVVERRPRSDA